MFYFVNGERSKSRRIPEASIRGHSRPQDPPEAALLTLPDLGSMDALKATLETALIDLRIAR
jgi:hypothetical protein